MNRVKIIVWTRVLQEPRRKYIDALNLNVHYPLRGKAAIDYKLRVKACRRSRLVRGRKICVR